jgi:AcrR family transcriptional regulator
MATETARDPARPKRADARRNYERLLAEARTTFTAHGTDASLEDIAKRAGVGIGTLYRHFPNRYALMGAVFQGEVDALLTRSRELLDAEEPCQALLEWLRAVITHAGTYRGLARALMCSSHDEHSALARCNVPMRGAGSMLLVRAQRAEAVRRDVEISDLLQLTNAIALAVEESPGDPDLMDRLLQLTLTGLRDSASEACGPPAGARSATSPGTASPGAVGTATADGGAAPPG